MSNTEHNTRTRRGKPPTHHKGLIVAITVAEARAIVWDAEAATLPLGEYEIELLAMEDETHFLVVRGAKQPDPEHPDPNLVIVSDGALGQSELSAVSRVR